MVRDEKDDRLLPHPTRRQNRLTGEGQKSSLGSGKKQGNSRDKSEIQCQFKFCKNPSCGFWHPPVCLNCKSEKLAHMATNTISDMLTESPTRSRRKVGAKGSVATVKEYTQLGCAYQGSFPRKSIPREPGLLGSKHTVKFKALGTK